MEAKELRIGNIVADDKGNVVALLSLGVGGENNPGICVGSYTDKSVKQWMRHKCGLFGIPLTEEWLLRFGFVREYDASWVFENFNAFSVCTGSKVPHHINFGKSTVMSSAFRNKEETIYVHELQNLYFILTGKELTFPPPPL
jgi:hypothetical protein